MEVYKMNERSGTIFSIEVSNCGIQEHEILKIVKQMTLRPKKIHMALGKYKKWFDLIYPPVTELLADDITDEILTAFKETTEHEYFPLDLHHYTYRTILPKF